jgi:hypothetical protein
MQEEEIKVIDTHQKYVEHQKKLTVTPDMQDELYKGIPANRVPKILKLIRNLPSYKDPNQDGFLTSELRARMMEKRYSEKQIVFFEAWCDKYAFSFHDGKSEAEKMSEDLLRSYTG